MPIPGTEPWAPICMAVSTKNSIPVSTVKPGISLVRIMYSRRMLELPPLSLRARIVPSRASISTVAGSRGVFTKTGTL